MKKLLSLLLVLSLCMSLAVLLSSCDKELDEKEWKEAFNETNFENVTVKYEFTHEGVLNKHVAKFTKDGVYRSIEAFKDDKSVGKQEHYFEGEDATVQRNLFLKTFLSIVEKRENFEYDKENKVYIAASSSVRIDQAEGVYVEENVKDGKLTFDDKGNVEKFVCNLNEVAYYNGEKKSDMTIDVTWKFSDYDKTEITDAEKEHKAN